MPVFQHLNEAKRNHPLPMAQEVGACITCSYWEAETPRPVEEKDMVGVCIQPQLQGYALVVSGSSGCNHWAKQNGVGEAAENYAMRGEAAKA